MSRSYIAHDKAVASMRMYAQMIVFASIVGIALYILLVTGAAKLYFRNCQVPRLHRENGRAVETYSVDSPAIPLSAIRKYLFTTNILAYIKINIGPNKPKPVMEKVEQEMEPFCQPGEISRELYLQCVDHITSGGARTFKYTILPWTLLFFPFYYTLYFMVFSMQHISSKKDSFRRGTKLISAKMLRQKFQQAIRQQKNKDVLTYGGIDLPEDVERSHLLIMGATGTGKSVFLHGAIHSIQQRKRRRNLPHRLIIYDVKGDYIAKHWDRQSIIFSPFDQRTIGWSFFNEIENLADLDILTATLFDPGQNCRDPFWYTAAGGVFRAVCVYLMSRNKKSNADIWALFAGSVHEIADRLRELPLAERGALQHIDKHDSNLAASVISILRSRLGMFYYIKDLDGPFSFRKYIRQEDPRNLFLLNIFSFKQIFQQLMTFVVDVMIRETLSIPDSRERRIFFVIDEFGSLARLTSIFDFLTMARSKGGVMLCANQDLGSVEDVYGRPRKQTFFNNFNSSLSFRLNDPDTAEFLSKAYGEWEGIRIMESRQLSPSDLGDRFGLAEQQKTERILMPTEFMVQPDFRAIYRVANYGVAKVATPSGPKIYARFSDVAGPFVQTDRFDPATVQAAMAAGEVPRPAGAPAAADATPRLEPEPPGLAPDESGRPDL